MMTHTILSQVKQYYKSVDETYDNYQFLAFYTKKDRDNFLKYNKEEIEYYFMLKEFYI